MDVVGIAMRIREIAMKVSLLKSIGLAWTISIWVVCVFTLAYGDARGADIFGLKKGTTIEEIRLSFNRILTLEYRFQGYWQHRSSQSKKREVKRTKKAKESPF